MTKADRSKFSKTKYLLRIIHQSYDLTHTGTAVNGEGGFQDQWEMKHCNQTTRISQEPLDPLWKIEMYCCYRHEIKLDATKDQ